MRLFFFCLMLTVPAVSFSQTESRAVQPRAIISGGILGGEAEPGYAYQFSAGLAFGRCFAGVGVGYDDYNLRSIPLFTDLRVSVGRKQYVFFYGNAGHNFSRENGVEPSGPILKDDYFGGFYYDFGLGYRMPISRVHKVLFSAGYTMKHMRREEVIAGFCPLGNCFDPTINYNYKLGRIIFRMSWEIN